MDVSILNINYFNEAQCTLMYLYNKSVRRPRSSLNCLCLNKTFTLCFQKKKNQRTLFRSLIRVIQTQHPNYG